MVATLLTTLVLYMRIIRIDMGDGRFRHKGHHWLRGTWNPIGFGKVKPITRAPALAYATPVAVQTTVSTARYTACRLWPGGVIPAPAGNPRYKQGIARNGWVTSVIASPPCGGEGGVSRSTAPRRRSRPAMQRGPWKGLGRGGDRCTQIRQILAKAHGQGRQSALLASASMDPPLPQPLPHEGGEYIGSSQHFHSHPRIECRLARVALARYMSNNGRWQS